MSIAVNTAIRDAFAAAVEASKGKKNAVTGTVKNALRRKSGVTIRKNLWSVERERK